MSQDDSHDPTPPVMGRPKLEKPRHVTSVNLDVEVREKLDETARAQGISRSELTNVLLEQGLDAAHTTEGEPVEVCFGSSKGRSVRVASDGDMDVAQIKLEGFKAFRGQISAWTRIGIIFGTKTGVRGQESYRFFELVPGVEFQRFHLDDAYYLEGFVEVEQKAYGLADANSAFKAFKATL